MDSIIEVNHISKAYKLYNKKSDRLREALSKGRSYYHLFYALNDISFVVERGESLGIIGTNGSGKSTLLKILTNVVEPTEGSFSVNGKISALLELGAGFNPEYTGLENIALHGTMMGYTQAEMVKRTEEIISFADVGEYINQPVKNYSSGMFARLAFAAAVNVEPDILIVDEVLSVGDMRFQIKCMDRMKQMREQGTTILYVSHDISSVRRFCKRCLWLDQGILKGIGDCNVVADQYSDFLKCKDNTNMTIKLDNSVDAECDDGLPQFMPDNGSSIAAVVDFKVEGENENDGYLDYDEPVKVTVTYDVYDENVTNPVLGDRKSVV